MEELADPELAARLQQLRAKPNQPSRTIGATELRHRRHAAIRPPGPKLARVADLIVSGEVAIPVRLYQPTMGALPLLVFFHGGGWTVGDLTTHDGTCRRIAKEADVAVLAVDYRLAPENPWPAAVDDAVLVTLWAFAHAHELVGSDIVAVAGDSAGGNLAALVCLRLRDERRRMPDAQVLIYPNTDLTFSQPSVKEKGAGWGLDADDALWYAEQWVPDSALRANPRISPLFEPDLSGLPPTIVVTAEHDPLRDEGNAYANKLRNSGVLVIARCEPGLVHGFLGLSSVSPIATNAAQRLYRDVQQLLQGNSEITA